MCSGQRHGLPSFGTAGSGCLPVGALFGVVGYGCLRSRGAGLERGLAVGESSLADGGGGVAAADAPAGEHVGHPKQEGWGPFHLLGSLPSKPELRQQ